MTRVLVTNDDGIDSPGVAVLARVARRLGADVTLAAPSWNSSGASAALTGVQEDGRLGTEIRPWEDPDIRAIAVDASPAMITVVALNGGFGPRPDLVLSGVNIGRNTGAAVLHSGTVGAALTAANHGVPGLAVSIDSDAPRHWETADAVAHHVLTWMIGGRALGTVNLNVPDRPIDQVEGLASVGLARVGAVQTTVTEAGEGMLQLSFAEPEAAAPGTDAAELADGWAVLTPLAPVGVAPEPDLDGLVAAWR